jgi:hypothetical protein
VTKQTKIIMGAHALSLLALLTPVGLQAQNIEMNFFVAAEGASWGADQSALYVSDTQCNDLAYARGFGHFEWRAYLSDGEETARDRIGSGPWINYYGVVIAESVEQLHSNENNLSAETAVTQEGEYAPESLALPAGSKLEGSLYDRAGPFFCFGVG